MKKTMFIIRKNDKFCFVVSLLLFLFLFVPLILYTFNSNDYSSKLDVQYEKRQHFNKYSVWPTFNIQNVFNPTTSKNNYGKNTRSKCLKHYDSDQSLSIANFLKIISVWSFSSDIDCTSLYAFFNNIYEINTKINVLSVPDTLVSKFKSWLGNNENLYKNVESQELLFVYNRYTFEENGYNLLRGKRPIKPPEIDPNVYFSKLIKETQQVCDFCSYKNSTAINQYGRLETEYSFSTANAFPFNKFHAMFLPKKHNLLELTYTEFRDLLYLPIRWFSLIQKNNMDYIYPVILWDFTPKGGASQMHPHLHATIDNKKYYGLFETIRNGAENYYQDTNRNYFNDLVAIHDVLGLTFKHKNSVFIISLTPKKDYDVTILSEDYNDSVIELLYATLWTYFEDLHIHPFSMSIYLPPLTKRQDGLIPLYVKIIPRGDISSLRSELSSLELLSVFNVNQDQYEVIDLYKTSFSKRLSQFR